MRRKILKKFLAAFLAAVCLPITSLSVPTEVQGAAVEGNVSVVTSGDAITIGNNYISRQFSIAGGKLSTTNITNKRTDGEDTVFTPAAGSEEFKIRLVKSDADPEPEPITISKIDKSGWTAEADSYQDERTGNVDGNAGNLIDGKTSTIWHTKYDDKGQNGKGQTQFPYNVIFNLGKATTFQCFSYTPRSQGEDTNGNLKEYELYYSMSQTALAIDSEDWILLKKGKFKYDDVNPIYVNLDEECTATQLKLKAISANNGSSFGGGAEFDLHAEKAPEVATKVNREFASSDLTLQGTPVVEDTQAVINNVEKSGKKITFHFEPFTFREIEYTISEVLVMYDGDHFMRKYMEISIPEEKRAAADAAIDYIDLESLVTNDTDATWTIPTGIGGIVQMEEFKANLGQPIYIQGMFFGCEFPAADNEINEDDGTGYLRYYTGKTFDRLQKDGQLTEDGKYVTWQTVAGAARSTENEVIQADFFEYIKSIATPSEFRIQYNSWFDNMMFIDDDNILSSFVEIDRELNKVEVRPLDSYVVDDGWNNYNDVAPPESDTTLIRRSGTTLNEDGFWTFNEKFPQGLTPSSELVHKFGSNFGVWVGPRGGYNYEGKIANIIRDAGKGSKAGSIDVADRTYVENFTDMAVDWMEKYKINYWKWDGFVDNSQYGTWPATDGVPGYANHHMTGGYHRMYHVTDLWEAWIDLMERVRQCEKEEGINKLWISLTCYVNPSPWYLQWANSVWIQCIHDQKDAGGSSSKMDRQITYRDACYYDFIKSHQFQFPLSNIYNHDPVYGKTDTGMNINTATDEQFKNYLYMLSTRGTAFWELYFSDSIMTDGKYEVTGEFLEWAEENYHMLKNSKMFGQSPNSNVKLNSVSEGETNAYGFSCFDGTDGIISFRNPATTEKSVTITFDRTIGVPESAGTLKYHIEHSHNLTAGTPTTGELVYGEEYTITLQPDEVRILRVSQNGDTTAPEIARAYSDGADGVIVKFNEKVTAGTFEVNEAEASASASPDGITFHLTAPADALTGKDAITVTANGVKDLAGNDLVNNTVTFPYHEKGMLAASEDAVAGEKVVSKKENSLVGNNGFSVSAEIFTTSTGAVLTQGKEYSIGINEDGTAYFTFNGVTAVSQAKVNDATSHTITGVKENNGMMKIYVDGVLEGSAYSKDNRYYEVKAADIVIGNLDFSGIVNAQITGLAMGYDAVGDEYGSENGDDEELEDGQEYNWASGKEVTAKWAANGINAAGNTARPMSMTVDGVKNDVNNYGEFGEDGNTASSYMQVDLGKVRSISDINLYRYWTGGRTYNGTVIALSKTADFTDKEIVYNSDADNFHGLGAGNESLYAETADGKKIHLDTAVEARYVRVYMHGSTSGQTNHVVEIEVIGTHSSSNEADYTAVNAAKEVAGKLNRDDYVSLDPVEQALNSVVEGKPASEQEEVNAMAAAILNAISSLEKVPRKKLEDAVKKAEKEELEDYTEESIAEYNKIVSSAKEVLDDSSSTEAALRAAFAQISTAKNVLKTPAEQEAAEIAKKDLGDVISKAEAYKDSSKYTKVSWDALQKALTDAKDVWGKTGGKMSDFETAKKALEAAISGLKEDTAQQISEGGNYTVGDYKYKVTSLSNQTVEVAGLANQNLTKINITETISLGGKTYTITSIGKSAFKKNQKVTTVVLGKNIIKVDNSAFEGCKKLKKVTIKSRNLTQIGKKAFMNCKNLKKVTIKSKKLKKLAKNAFKGIHKKAVIKNASKKK